MLITENHLFFYKLSNAAGFNLLGFTIVLHKRTADCQTEGQTRFHAFFKLNSI